MVGIYFSLLLVTVIVTGSELGSTPATSLSPRCNERLQRGTCNNFVVKWYYDRFSHRCREFFYSGCDGNQNRFDSFDECHQSCHNEDLDPVVARCTLLFDKGNCTGDFPRWYYDIRTNQCTCGSWSGCGGNDNRFYTPEHCMKVCGQFVVNPVLPKFAIATNSKKYNTTAVPNISLRETQKPGQTVSSGYRNIFENNDRRVPDAAAQKPQPLMATENTLGAPNSNGTWMKLFHRQRTQYIQDPASGQKRIVAVEHQTGAVRDGKLLNEHRYQYTTNDSTSFPKPVTKQQPKQPVIPQIANQRPQQDSKKLKFVLPNGSRIPAAPIKHEPQPPNRNTITFVGNNYKHQQTTQPQVYPYVPQVTPRPGHPVPSPNSQLPRQPPKASIVVHPYDNRKHPEIAKPQQQILSQTLHPGQPGYNAALTNPAYVQQPQQQPQQVPQKGYVAPATPTLVRPLLETQDKDKRKKDRKDAVFKMLKKQEKEWKVQQRLQKLKQGQTVAPSQYPVAPPAPKPHVPDVSPPKPHVPGVSHVGYQHPSPPPMPVAPKGWVPQQPSEAVHSRSRPMPETPYVLPRINPVQPTLSPRVTWTPPISATAQLFTPPSTKVQPPPAPVNPQTGVEVKTSQYQQDKIGVKAPETKSSDRHDDSFSEEYFEDFEEEAEYEDTNDPLQFFKKNQKKDMYQELEAAESPEEFVYADDEIGL